MPRKGHYASVMERTPFTIATSDGELSGWVSGAGRRVLAIHSGPGMSFGYPDDAVAELGAQPGGDLPAAGSRAIH